MTRRCYSYIPAGGLTLSGSATVSRSRAIVASGGLALGVTSGAKRVRSGSGRSRFVLGGSAEVQTHNATCDTELEEIVRTDPITG
jgi:hypothetical protein